MLGFFYFWGMKQLVFASVLALGISACSQNSKKVEVHKYAMDAFGSNLNITYTGEELKGLDFAVKTFVENFNASLSTYDPSSTISRINANEESKIDSLNFKVLQQGMWWTKYSGGAFDLSVGPLVDLWGFGKNKPTQVDSAQVDSVRRYVGYGVFTVNKMILAKSYPEVRIDYNAIAPGFAADMLGDILTQKGCTNFYINVGGEIKCSGYNQDSAFWLIGIEKPIDNPGGQNEAMRYIRVMNQGLATSGNYRKFYEMDGKRYSHTIDPRSGYPVQHDLLSVTILAPEASTADVLATTCMVFGRKGAKEYLAQLQNVEYYFIYTGEDGTFKEEWSPGLEKQFVEEK